MNRTLRIRLGIVSVASLLTLLVAIQPGHSQIGGPGGGIRGGPPINPGMPGPPGGIGGGISGRPPGFPEIPRPPIGGGGIGGGGGETEWLCGLCRKVLARGPTPPAETICPLCRTKNVAPGTRPGDPNPGGGLIPPTPPGPALPPAGGPPIVGPQANLIVPPAPPANAPPAVAYAPPSYEDGSSRRYNTTKWILISLAMLILLAIGMGGVIYAIVKQQPTKKVRRKPRRRLLDDDDY